MANYTYEAMNTQGKLINGTVNADDESAAVSRLADVGLFIVSLNMKKEKAKAAKQRRKRVKVADLALFSRQLSAMLGAGIPITQALATLGRQTENLTLRDALSDIAASVESGMGLMDSFAMHPKIFSKLYVSMIGAGEISGTLETVLDRLAIMLQKDKQLNDNVNAATTYPKVIGVFALFMFFAMLIFLVPIFEGFLPEGTDINPVTQMTFDLSHSIRYQWYIWLLAMSAIFGAIVMFVKSPTGHNLWERYKLRMPLFGAIIHKTVVARFARTLATLLQGGISVVQALQSAGPTSGSDLVSVAVDQAITEIEAGKNVAGPLGASGLFPPMMINMIAVGEEAGTMPELLDRIAEFFEEDVATLTKSLSSIIEPIMLVFIGILVGGMLLSLYLPIFSVVTASM